MTQKHTLGPCTIGHSGNRRIYGPDGLGPIAVVLYQHNPEIQKAYARLFAASPDMADEIVRLKASNAELVEALSVALADLCDFNKFDQEECTTNIICAGYAAIRKAGPNDET